MPAEAVRPTVSVALCTHNGAEFIAEQLSSILNQSIPVDEIVVSDDASTDSTIASARAVLEKGAAAFGVLHNAPALGVTANFEQAIRATTGDIVILSDQDDVWHPDRVAGAISAFTSDASLELQFGNARLIDGGGVPTGSDLFGVLEFSEADRRAVSDGRAFDQFLRRNVATGATVAFRRTLLDTALPFPVPWVHDEWLAVLAAAREGISAAPDELIDYRQHGNNQIGVVEPTIRRKIARVLQPRGQRNTELAKRSRILLERLESIGASADVVSRAREKVAIEEFRAALPANRALRILPVLRRAASGDYARYCSQGALDVVRDLLQPA